MFGRCWRRVGKEKRDVEEVNKNLIGTGYMSTDQKKKLLWGNKKNTTAEESGHRWDATLFSDRERQEKFNKLMGVKGELKVEHKPDNQESSGFEKQTEQLQLDLEKQYTAGLRRRDGRTVGLGSADVNSAFMELKGWGDPATTTALDA
ncbi:hypothetical protein Acr_12g0006910 [Actinidia rufa]|uniref:Small acidic protein-like domain-containing protein n=1 Tax=Actinidia rufa TaxID=165716 RepID=A0A7J0FHH8_9ERIC|nr:hypothetical protein Acr_12g0006910 [Actinidia rufa]